MLLGESKVACFGYDHFPVTLTQCHQDAKTGFLTLSIDEDAFVVHRVLEFLYTGTLDLSYLEVWDMEHLMEVTLTAM
jgi:hypothetical protein